MKNGPTISIGYGLSTGTPGQTNAATKDFSLVAARGKLRMSYPLEFDAHTELNPAAARDSIRRNELTGNDTKSARVGQRQTWIGEVDVIGEVEEVERERHVQSFLDRCFLPQRHIHIPARQPAQRIGPASAAVAADLDAAEAVEDLFRVRKQIET